MGPGVLLSVALENAESRAHHMSPTPPKRRAKLVSF
jgi:hypothetical protein